MSTVPIREWKRSKRAIFFAERFRDPDGRLFEVGELKTPYDLVDEFLKSLDTAVLRPKRMPSNCERCNAPIPLTPTGRTPRRKLCGSCRDKSNYEKKVEDVGKPQLRQVWKARKAAQRAKKRQEASDGKKA